MGDGCSDSVERAFVIGSKLRAQSVSWDSPGKGSWDLNQARQKTDNFFKPHLDEGFLLFYAFFFFLVFQLLNGETLEMYVDTAFTHLFLHHAFIEVFPCASCLPMCWGQSWAKWTRAVSPTRDMRFLREARQSEGDTDLGGITPMLHCLWPEMTHVTFALGPQARASLRVTA